jgi:hypothetical protein
MTWSPDLTTTGGAQTNLTTPTYTYVADAAPQANARQYVVTTLGGTQTGVRKHTAGDPFRLRLTRQPYKAVPPKNPVTGAYGNVPLNRTEFLFQKGMKIDSTGTIRVGQVRIIVEIPAGAETNDSINIEAMTSFCIGTLWEESADVGESLITGII